MTNYYVLHYNPGSDGTVINLLQGVMALGKKRKLDDGTVFKVGVVSQATKNLNVLDWNCDSPGLISPKAQNTLLQLNLPDVDLISTYSENDALNAIGLKALHCRNRISCIDLEKSDVDGDVVIFGVKKLVLNEEALSAADEPRRHLFSHPGAAHILLASDRVAKALQEAQLSGLVVTPVQEYTC